MKSVNGPRRRLMTAALCVAGGLGSAGIGADAMPPAIDVPDEAREAVATVDRFLAALVAGDTTSAGNELDPELLVLEGGGAERTAAEYLGGHAAHDAEFLKHARLELVHRKARVAGALAWVASESVIVLEQSEEPITLDSAETMVLRPTDTGWKIVHIHWSSRIRKPSPEE